MKFLKIIPILMLCLLFMGCSILDSIALKAGYKDLNKANIELKAKQDELSQVKLDSIKAINDAKDQVVKQKDMQYTQLYDNFTNTSSWVYGTWISAQLNQSKYPSRLADIIFLKSDSALKFSLGPTKEAIIAQNQSLIDELNEQKTTNIQLQAKYDKVAQVAQDAQQKLKDDDLAVINAQKNADKIKLDKQAEIDAKQKDVDAAQIAKSKAEDEVRTSQAKSLADIKKEQNVKHIIEISLLALATLFILGAVYGPINLKLESAGGGAACLGLVFLVSFIEPWMIFVAFGVIIAIVGISMYIKHNKESKLNTNLVGAIQDVKTEANDVYNNTIKPKLQDWMKDTPKLSDEVDKKLVQLNLVNKSDIKN